MVDHMIQTPLALYECMEKNKIKIILYNIIYIYIYIYIFIFIYLFIFKTRIVLE
jgi:hypothetical protein